MPARHVVIRNNTIAGVNFGMGSRDAAIDIFAAVGNAPAPRPVHQGIIIEDNTITNATGSAIHVGSAEQVIIRGNRFVDPSVAGVTIDHSRDIDIAGNVLVGSVKGVIVGPGVQAGTVHVEGNTGF
jgi:hypothetical protein